MTDKAHRLTDISIHALLAVSDLSITVFNLPVEISIHALLAESDWIILESSFPH